VDPGLEKARMESQSWDIPKYVLWHKRGREGVKQKVTNDTGAEMRGDPMDLKRIE